MLYALPYPVFLRIASFPKGIIQRSCGQYKVSFILCIIEKVNFHKVFKKALHSYNLGEWLIVMAYILQHRRNLNIDVKIINCDKNISDVQKASLKILVPQCLLYFYFTIQLQYNTRNTEGMGGQNNTHDYIVAHTFTFKWSFWVFCHTCLVINARKNRQIIIAP